MQNKELTGYPSIDKPWLKYYPDESEKIPVPSLSIYQLFAENLDEKKDITAVNYYDCKINYKKLDERIHKTARAFKGIGVNENEIVCLLLPNVPEARIMMYALNMLGAIVYPINFMLPVREYIKILEENKVKTVVIFDKFMEKYLSSTKATTYIKNIICLNGKESIPYANTVEQVKNFFTKSLISAGTKINIFNYSEFMKRSNGISDTVPYFKKNSIAAIIGTSGTTGTPKGVCLTNENMNAMALQHKYGNMNFAQGDQLLDVLMLFIGYGIATAHYSWVLGLEVIMIPDMCLDIYPYLIKYNPPLFTGGPIHYETLFKTIDGDISKLPPQKNMVSGGASLDKTLEKNFNHSFEGYIESDKSNIYIRQGLGCTENGGAATYAKKGTYKFGGVGIPLLFENMAIFEAGTDKELPYNMNGEICISGPTVMQGYLNNPQETEKVLIKHSDGHIWLHTGDLGYIDEDGQVFIMDRIKNIFMRLGFNVHPSYITEQIKKIDMVDDCIVVGVDHPKEQKVPVAFVKPADLHLDLAIVYDTIMKECIAQLEAPSIPYEIFFVDQLPHNLGGKVDTAYLIDAAKIDYIKSEKCSKMNLLKLNPVR